MHVQIYGLGYVYPTDTPECLALSNKPAALYQHPRGFRLSRISPTRADTMLHTGLTAYFIGHSATADAEMSQRSEQDERSASNLNSGCYLLWHFATSICG